jgi:predicted XRE-type DNA-binding protein
MRLNINNFKKWLNVYVNNVYLCMEVLKIDRTKLYTQSEYAKKIGVSRARVNHMIRDNLLNVVEIKGAKLVYID